MRWSVGAWAAVAVTVTAVGGWAATGGGTITTIAGDRGNTELRCSPFGGDGGPAIRAKLCGPWGVAVDAQGNVYVADSGNHRVRRVNPSGTITTVAGGDIPPGTSRSGPDWLAVDPQGNVYISDGFMLVSKLSRAGVLTTVAGTKWSGGETFSGDGGPATEARLFHPEGLAFDGRGNLYIADSANRRVRRVTPSGTITTVAGTGVAGFSGDGGPATQARLGTVSGLAVDRQGNLYIGDYAEARVRKVSPSGTITTIAGTGTPGFSGDGGPGARAKISPPMGVAVDRSGNVLIADGIYRVRMVRPDGTISTFAGSNATRLGDGGPATAAALSGPRGVAVDARGNVYVTETTGHRVRKITAGAAPATGTGTSAATRQLRTFADRVGKILQQSAAGRRTLAGALTAGFNCSITPRAAGERVNRVVANRQGLLRQLVGVQAPTPQATKALRLLRQGIQHSIEADIRYRDGFYALRTRGCPLPPNRSFTLARQSDTRASAAKRQFVAVYNPIAKRVGRRTWSANEI